MGLIWLNMLYYTPIRSPHPIPTLKLVGGIPTTPLKNMSLSVGMIFPFPTVSIVGIQQYGYHVG